MNISFSILQYTEAESIKEWEKVHKGLPLEEDASAEPEKVNKRWSIENVLLGILMTFLLLLILFSVSISFQTISFAYVIYIVLSVTFFLTIFFGLLGYIKHAIFGSKQKGKSLSNFGEKMTFFDEKIKIKSPIQSSNMEFLYTEIQDFLVCYKSVKDEGFSGEIAVLRWKYQDKNYQYTIRVLFTEKRYLLDVLSFLYITFPIKEIDGNGRNLYLLEEIKKQKIEENVLNLIDEIGKDEDL